MNFCIKYFFSKCDQIRSQPNPQSDLVKFTEEILNGKLHFCAVLVVTCIHKKVSS